MYLDDWILNLKNKVVLNSNLTMCLIMSCIQSSLLIGHGIQIIFAVVSKYFFGTTYSFRFNFTGKSTCTLLFTSVPKLSLTNQFNWTTSLYSNLGKCNCLFVLSKIPHLSHIKDSSFLAGVYCFIQSFSRKFKISLTFIKKANIQLFVIELTLIYKHRLKLEFEFNLRNMCRILNDYQLRQLGFLNNRDNFCKKRNI